MHVNIKTLIGKLNPTCKKGLEKAAELCVSKGNFTVEIEHYLLELLKAADTDLSVILPYYSFDQALLESQLTQTIESFKRGSNRTPSLSPLLVTLIENAWLHCSLDLSLSQIRSAGILTALLSTEQVRGVILEKCPVLLNLSQHKLEEDIKDILRASKEDVGGDIGAPTQSAPGTGRTSTQALDQYTIDISAQAAAGKIDPIAGRDQEIRQVIDILTRRRQNNPILVGDAGVGKTAIVEGLALRIHQGDVPPALKNVTLRTLDMGLLEAGASIKGEFENRLKSVMDEVKGSTKPIILFIDEAHTLIGGGANEGGNDAANLLKPALARGELKTIAATTWDEYKKYFEKDAALTRRFQVVKVEEPSEDVAINMLRSVMEKLEQHHHVTILDQGLRAAVQLSHRYLPGRKLPDKGVSVLDTACARVHMAQTATPLPIEEMVRHLDMLEAEQKRLQREKLEGISTHEERLDAIEVEIQTTAGNLKNMTAQWKQELAVVENILAEQLALHKRAQNEMDPNDAEIQERKETILFLKKQLENLSAEKPLIPLAVGPQEIAEVLASWTGIPVGKMMKDELSTVLGLQGILSQRLIGQKAALQTITEHIWAYRAGLQEPGKPVGVFLLVGPSGVGKTETALAIADVLYGGERNVITVNMSEYQEAHSVSSLRGSPPGYVGYGKGGVLTEAVRRAPYSIVLLDEVEKAHPDVMELFYQTFDKGVMEDGEGIEVDYKNTIILMTSNLASDEIAEAYQKNKNQAPTNLVEEIRPVLQEHFKPAFLGRLTLVPYHPLTHHEIQKIVHLKLDKIQKRYKKQHDALLEFSLDIHKMLLAKCAESNTGARMIDYVIHQNLLPVLSAEILKRIANEAPKANLYVALNADGKLSCDFTDKTAAASA